MPQSTEASQHAAMLETIIAERVSFAFLADIPGGGDIDEQSVQMRSYLKKLARNALYRERSVLTAEMLRSGIVAAIVERIFAAGSDLSGRLTAENRFPLDGERLRSLLTAALLMRDLVYAKGVVYDAYRCEAPRYDAQAKVFIDETLHLCEKIMPSVSNIFCSIVYKSVIRFRPDDHSVLAVSRLIAVLDHFSKLLALTADSAECTLSRTVSAAHILASNAAFFGIDPAIAAAVRTIVEDIP